jgi:hypothetical protein
VWTVVTHIESFVVVSGWWLAAWFAGVMEILGGTAPQV